MVAVDIEVGDRLLLPGTGEFDVIEIDLRTDVITGRLGASKIVVEFRYEDVYPIPLPEHGDPQALEDWLRCKAAIRPLPFAERRNDPCKAVCKCAYCNNVTLTVKEWNKPERVEVQHMVDAPACRCAETNCWCLVNVS